MGFAVSKGELDVGEARLGGAGGDRSWAAGDHLAGVNLSGLGLRVEPLGGLPGFKLPHCAAAFLGEVQFSIIPVTYTNECGRVPREDTNLKGYISQPLFQ